MLFVFVTCCSR